jgi:hypothetical protein
MHGAMVPHGTVQSFGANVPTHDTGKRGLGEETVIIGFGCLDQMTNGPLLLQLVNDLISPGPLELIQKEMLSQYKI